MVMLLGDLQRIMGRKGQVTGFAIMVDHPDNEAEVDRIIKDITALGPTIDAKRAADSVTGTTEIRFIRATSWITSAIAIIIGAVGMLNTMIMSVAERTTRDRHPPGDRLAALAHRANDHGRIGAAEPLRRRGRNHRRGRPDQRARPSIPPSPA